MKKRRILIDPDAKEDLRGLHAYVVMQGAPQSADAYVRRIQLFVRSLDLGTERGTALDDIEPGFRVIPFESVVIALRVRPTEAIVVRVFHASQDWLKQLSREAAKRQNRA